MNAEVHMVDGLCRFLDRLIWLEFSGPGGMPVKLCRWCGGIKPTHAQNCFVKNAEDASRNGDRQDERP